MAQLPWLNLHLAVCHGLDSDKDHTAHAMGVCRNLVKTFNLSWLKKRDLRKAQTEASLVLDVATRWGSKQKMIDRVLEQLPAIRRVLTFSQGEKYVTVSSVKPVLELLKGELLSPDPSDTELTAKIKENMCRVLTEKYSPPEIQDLLRKATILDPRYRGSMEDEEVMDDVKHQLVQELLDMKEEGRSEESARTENNGDGGSEHAAS
ncbi:hypothetical protein SRHO_G00343660 [Serrasalmus rhombeus]